MMTLLTTGILSLAFLVPGTGPWFEYRSQQRKASLVRLCEQFEKSLATIAKLKKEARELNHDGKFDLFLKDMDETERFYQGMLAEFRAFQRMRFGKP